MTYFEEALNARQDDAALSVPRIKIHRDPFLHAFGDENQAQEFVNELIYHAQRLAFTIPQIDRQGYGTIIRLSCISMFEMDELLQCMPPEIYPTTIGSAFLQKDHQHYTELIEHCSAAGIFSKTLLTRNNGSPEIQFTIPPGTDLAKAKSALYQAIDSFNEKCPPDESLTLRSAQYSSLELSR